MTGRERGEKVVAGYHGERDPAYGGFVIFGRVAEGGGCWDWAFGAGGGGGGGGG